jgi:hypothetical protein
MQERAVTWNAWQYENINISVAPASDKCGRCMAVPCADRYPPPPV